MASFLFLCLCDLSLSLLGTYLSGLICVQCRGPFSRKFFPFFHGSYAFFFLVMLGILGATGVVLDSGDLSWFPA